MCTAYELLDRELRRPFGGLTMPVRLAVMVFSPVLRGLPNSAPVAAAGSPRRVFIAATFSIYLTRVTADISPQNQSTNYSIAGTNQGPDLQDIL